MAGYSFPSTPDIDEAYRSASTALAALLPPTSPDSGSSDSLLDLLSQWPRLVREAELAVIAQIGPSVSWTSPRCDEDWDLIATGVDLDDDREFGEIQLDDNAFEGAHGSWADSALGQAGLVYKRACGWDFAPGDAGIWLLMLAPVAASSAGENSLWFFDGRVTGFVVLHDRDHDGDHETVAHIWTATAWRRRGIAQHLLAKARSRFPITTFEEPYTNDGAAFLDASPAC